MKTRIIFPIVLTVVTILSSTAFAQKRDKKNKEQQPAVTEVKVTKTTFKTNTDTISYIIGTDIAGSFVKNGIDINLPFLEQGLKDALSKTDTLFTQEQIQTIMGAWNQKMLAKKQASEKVTLDTNKAKSQSFLDKNKTKDGVKVTPSGLQYKVIKEGTGDSPLATDEVEVHYVGKLVNGTVFDSSRDRGQPVTFPVNGVIPGWTEGLQLMRPGSIFEFYIPSDLAYGDKGAGPIPAGSALIFEVELLKVSKPAATDKPADQGDQKPDQEEKK